jgi:hypothetical protein
MPEVVTVQVGVEHGTASEREIALDAAAAI